MAGMNREQVLRLHTRYIAGDASAEELGEEIGLTRQRVHQLFKSYGLPTHSRSHAARIRSDRRKRVPA